MINSIVIKDLEVHCIIGIHEWEQKSPQKILIDLKAYFDFSHVLQSRSIKDTVDYTAVSCLIEQVAQNGHYKLLEVMAANISNALYENFPITSLEFEIKKLPPPEEKKSKGDPRARYVGVAFRTGRNLPIEMKVPRSAPDKKTPEKIYKDRVALITGSVKGLGKAFAIHLGSLGAKVAIHYRQSRDQANDLVKSLKQEGIQTQAFYGELASAADMKNLAQNVLHEFGKVDFLINNVGMFTTKTLEEISPEEFNQIIQANICGTFYLSREILPQMRKQKFGRIINIGHACAERIRAYKTETPYYISKTGILILTKSLATQEAPHGITCNMISPGVMINNTYFPADIFRNIPMGRLAQFEDFMGALDFLLSDQAHYITGTAIDVSGGFNL